MKVEGWGIFYLSLVSLSITLNFWMYRAQDSVFSPKPQRKGPGDPGPSLKELFMRPALSPVSLSQPAPLAGHSAWQHPSLQFPRRDDGNSWPYASRQVESCLFWKVILPQFPRFLKQMIFNCTTSLISQFENLIKRAAFRTLQPFKVGGVVRLQSWGQGLCRCCLGTSTAATFQRPRETRLPHSVRANVPS